MKYVCKKRCYGFKGQLWEVGQTVDVSEADLAHAKVNGLSHFEPAETKAKAEQAPAPAPAKAKVEAPASQKSKL